MEKPSDTRKEEPTGSIRARGNFSRPPEMRMTKAPAESAHLPSVLVMHASEMTISEWELLWNRNSGGGGLHIVMGIISCKKNT